MAVQLSNLIPRILVHLPQASNMLVKQQLQDTVVDFYGRTKVKKQVLDPVAVVANQPDYTILMPAGYALEQFDWVKVRGQVLEEKSEDTLDLQWHSIAKGYSYRYQHGYEVGANPVQNWRDATASTPKFYFTDSVGKLRLVATPDTAWTGTDGIVACAVLKPFSSVTEIDDAIYHDWYQALAEGTLARMMKLPKRPWTDYALSEKHEEMYEDAVAEALDKSLRSNNRNDRPVMHTTTYA